MSTVPNPVIVEAAITALKPFHPASAEQVADMLLFWVRRHELTDADLAEVQHRMFPARTSAERFLDRQRQARAADLLDRTGWTCGECGMPMTRIRSRRTARAASRADCFT